MSRSRNARKRRYASCACGVCTRRFYDDPRALALRDEIEACDGMHWLEYQDIGGWGPWWSECQDCGSDTTFYACDCVGMCATTPALTHRPFAEAA